MKIKKSFLILSLILVWTFNVQAQFDVNLHITDGIADTVVQSAIENNSSLFLSEIGKAFLEERIPEFTGIDISLEAAKTILGIWNNTGVMNCNVSELNRKCLKRYDGGYQIRDIPILMLAAAPDDQQQEIAINYTATGKIDEVFVYDKEKYGITTMLTEGTEVKEIWRRQRIQDFVEQFRTAYNTKDLNFLDTVYSDNALIITGKVIKVLHNNDRNINVPKERVDYIKQKKEQYMQKLKYIFATVKYINLDFSDVEIQQHPKYPEIYGVVFKQNWHSVYANNQKYDDDGYVFLMIDFKNENAPMIHIRTWQPKKYDGRELLPNEIFRVTSFNINNR
jgi:predicted nucleic acid-binding protein